MSAYIPVFGCVRRFRREVDVWILPHAAGIPPAQRDTANKEQWREFVLLLSDGHTCTTGSRAVNSRGKREDAAIRYAHFLRIGVLPLAAIAELAARLDVPPHTHIISQLMREQIGRLLGGQDIEAAYTDLPAFNALTLTGALVVRINAVAVPALLSMKGFVACAGRVLAVQQGESLRSTCLLLRETGIPALGALANQAEMCNVVGTLGARTDPSSGALRPPRPRPAML